MNALLDTSVLCELLRAQPSPAVLAWFAAQSADALFTSAVTQAELLLGASQLPASRRRDRLQLALEATFSDDLAGRVLPFDEAAAVACAALVARRIEAGRPISQVDAQVAGIAASRGLAVVTRNTADFDGCGVALIDPWLPAA